MKKYMKPATDVVATEMRLCDGMHANSGYGDPNGQQFAPLRRE